MYEYDEIYEELCYRVECGELSLEDAEIINEAAYDRYVLEGNAYNKYMNKNKDEVDKLNKRAEVFRSLGALDKADELQRKSEYLRRDVDKNILGNMYLHGYKKRGYINKNGNWESGRSGLRRDDVRFSKQEWMRQHGNEGKRPEERLKAGRYLNAQRELDKLNGRKR